MNLEQYQDYTQTANYLRGREIFQHWSESQGKDFYTMTMSLPNKKFKKFSDLTEREEVLGSVWRNLEHRINRQLDNNYKRNLYNRMNTFWFFEHKDKTNSKLVQPHIHATIAIPKHRSERFTSALTDAKDSKGNHVYTLKKRLIETNRDLLKVIIDKPKTIDDVYAWMGYTVKQQFNQI